MEISAGSADFLHPFACLADVMDVLNYRDILVIRYPLVFIIADLHHKSIPDTCFPGLTANKDV